MRKFLFLVFFSTIVCAMSAYWFDNMVRNPLPIEKSITIEMPSGANSRTLAKKLIKKQLI